MNEIKQKREKLFREWVLALYGNNEEYYYSTLGCGIPDGDSVEDVCNDLLDGFYDEDIDFTLFVYETAKESYARDGYYVRGNVYKEDDAWHIISSMLKEKHPEVYKLIFEEVM